MNDFTFSPDAMAEFMDWIKKDKKTANKIYSLIEDIRRNGAMQGIGKPESLKHRPGYSRRIDEKNRLVYDIDEL
ncbi:type II toxin-antitoxin system YoeB family toxin [Lachnospiraceae bacterium 66-29]